MPRFFVRPWFLGALALLATALVYWPGLSGAFLFDDYPNIVTNTRVQPETLDWQAIKTAASAYQPGYYGRPLATIGFALDFLAGGKNPWIYKVHSLALHLLNTLLVFLLASRLLRLAGGGEARRGALVAAAIALLWAAHPLQVSTVLYVVQRMEVLAHTFVLLGLLAYVSGRSRQIAGTPGWGRLVIAGLMLPLGMLSKESAVLLPLYTLALELVIFRFQAAKPADARALKALYAIGLGLGLAAYLYLVPGYLDPKTYEFRGFTWQERLLSQLRILPMYLGQMLVPLPSHMTFYYDDFVVSRSLLSPPTTLAGGLLLAGMAIAAWRLRARMPLFALGIAWFFAAHAITSNLHPLELAFEHRNYFALLGIVLAVYDLARRVPFPQGAARAALAAGAISLTLFFCVLRTLVWGNEFHLANELVAINPDSPRASNDLATLYYGLSGGVYDTPHFYFATKEFERGAKLPGSSPLAEQGLILMAAQADRPADPAWWNSFIEKYRTRPIGPQEQRALASLLAQHRATGKLDAVRLSEAYRTMLDRRPWPGYVYANYADFVLTEFQDEALAEDMYGRAIAANPQDTRLVSQIFSSLVSEGHEALARKLADRFGMKLELSSPGP